MLDREHAPAMSDDLPHCWGGVLSRKRQPLKPPSNVTLSHYVTKVSVSHDIEKSAMHDAILILTAASALGMQSNAAGSL
jgi:hypothetical protein